MGQKVNAVGMRVGINKDWNSKWFASKNEYGNFLVEDIKVRRFLEAELKNAMLSHINIGRVKTDKGYKVTIVCYVGKLGEALGSEGANVTRLTKVLEKMLKPAAVRLTMADVKNPDLDATLVAKWIANELENRAAFRSTMKKAIARMKKAGAKGCRTVCSGRLGGAEIARAEGYKEGVVPLHTLRADIDYASVPANTTYGNIGVKVWICRSLSKTTKEEVEEEAPRKEEKREARPSHVNKGGEK
ncbi:MAG: 30S ribosomal protein S3 [Bacilli bacterium]|nr:30S ribosomal protein S3 [Bacilli bacterium]